MINLNHDSMGRMGLNNLIYWCQKKIGTYDKQQWEKTLEQCILSGYSYVPLKTTKLKTELIDVDLVRGSSFPKAKPKHGLGTVARLALQRLLLLPLHRRWWVQQTSPRIFALFLLLYCLQLFNVGVYFYHIMNENNESEIVSTSEVMIPLAMMLMLCTIHSQIVSTSSGSPTDSRRSETKTRRSKRRRCHFGQKRAQRSLRINESKSSQDTASEKASTVSGDVPSSVRFAKKLVTENSNVLEPTEQVCYDACESHSENETEDALLQNRNPSINPIPPVNVHPADELQVDVQPNVEENVGNNGVAHQDDDGFESLNGNMSSDNAEIVADQPAVQQDGEVENLAEGGRVGCPEERRAWLEEIMVGKMPEQDTSHTRRFSVPIAPTMRGNYSDSEGDACNSLKDGGISTSLGSGRGQQCESEEEGECEDATANHLTEATTSATEWMGVTTNSDECSSSSELQESSHSEMNFSHNEFAEHPNSWEFELSSSILLCPSCTSPDRVSCTIWKHRDVRKAELSVLDISSAIIARVESMPESMDYFYGGLALSVVLSLIPSIWRLSDYIGKDSTSNVTMPLIPVNLTHFDAYSVTLCRFIDIAFGATLWERTVILVSLFERFTLSCLLFFLLAVAERTFKQRLLYAKLFSHLTSSRRARKSDLPHFRLNKVRNIKTWLSVRSYLKRRGPQRSVDVIVSAVFIVTLLLLSFVSLEFIKDLENLHSQYNVEALFWSFALGMFILRFMTLGTKMNTKYRNLSILITEQINLYLQIEQKPHKKDELMVANSVLKLAADLLKELESPFKISGLSAYPYLYTITKVVILSALSAVLSELLGFKLKLHKIKIK